MSDKVATSNPTASPVVSIGPSTILSALTAVSLILTGIFGKDWGIGENAQAISVGVGGLIVIGVTISRALQSNSLAGAAAAVYAAQLTAATSVAATPKVEATDVAQAANVLAAAAENTEPVDIESGTPPEG